MYERFHNLRERPFSLSPDPDYLYPSRVHKEALSYLRYGIEGRAGFIVITGEIGSGKTTLLQTALRSLDRQTSVARLVNTMLDARELLEAVMLDFGLDPGDGRSKPYLLRDLASFLVAQRLAGRLALLAIDEAQNLSFSALEEIRMLSNLETEKSKLIQIALIGQPNLRTLLARPELEQLRQRVTVSYHLQALDCADTAAYINHRLKRAAIGAPLQFPPDVTDLIHQHSQGIPRKINVISDAILLFAYGEEQHAITLALTHDVLDELEGTGVIAPPDTPPPATPLAIGPAVHVSDAAARSASSMGQEQQRVAEHDRQLIARQLGRHGDDPLFSVRPPAAAETAVIKAAPRVVEAAPAVVTPPRAVARPIIPPARPPAAAPTRKDNGFWTRLRRGLSILAWPAFEK